MDENSSLKKLSLSNSNLTTEIIPYLCIWLINNTTLEILDISHYPFSLNEIDLLAESIKKNRNLKELTLYNDEINDAGAKCLFSALSIHPTITSINFSLNRLSHIGIKYFADNLETNKTWKSVNFWGNKGVEDLGAQHISQSLTKNSTLTSLNLSTTSITDNGANYFSSALTKNQTLTMLNLNNNHLKQNSVNNFVSVFTHNFSLTDLCIRYNHHNIEENTIDLLNNFLTRNECYRLFMVVSAIIYASDDPENVFSTLPKELLPLIFKFSISLESEKKIQNKNPQFNLHGFFEKSQSTIYAIKNQNKNIPSSSIAEFKQSI
jgi:Ran GTPase-activating protein (RanGAP) involved in mRNA processing and transport